MKRFAVAVAGVVVLCCGAWGWAEPPAKDVERGGAAQAASFLEAAREVTESIQRTFWDETRGLYVQSVDKREPEFMWGNGVMFTALVAAARDNPGMYRPVLDRFFAAMDGYWDSKAPIAGYEPSPTKGHGHDKYYDDNEWMVITFVEAYEVTRDVKYLDRAQAALAFALSGWDDKLGGGIWWHEGHKGGSKNTCSNGPGAVACLRVAKFRDRSANIEWAKKIAAWTNEHLQDKDGLFFDHKVVDPPQVKGGKLTYNAALMERANLGLWRETKDERFLAEAKRIGGACDLFMKKDGMGYRDAKRFSHLLVEADLELYRATGDARALERARTTARHSWEAWKKSPQKELIEQAAVARMLWLVAEQESDAGRAFWKEADRAGADVGAK